MSAHSRYSDALTRQFDAATSLATLARNMMAESPRHNLTPGERGTLVDQQRLARHLAGAPTYYVSRSIADLLHHAANVFPDDYRVPQVEQLIVERPNGVVDLVASSGPLRTGNERGFIWSEHFGLPELERLPNIDVSYTPSALFWEVGYTYQTRLPFLALYGFAQIDRWFACVMRVVWHLERPLSWLLHVAHNRDLDEHPCDATDLLYFKFLLSLLLFVQDRILVSSPRLPQRHVARQIVRQHKIDHSPAVNVIELRPRVYAQSRSDEQREVETAWQCQWLVRGHWRRQWYPSLAAHQPKWIAPYLKGPDDKPLRANTTTLHAVVR